MPDKHFLAAIDGLNALFYSVIDVIGLVITIRLALLVLRNPTARIHRRWAIAWLISGVAGFLLRIVYDIRLAVGVRWHAAPIVWLHVVGWTVSLVGLYGSVQLWKAFRGLSRRHADQHLTEIPFEAWPARAASAAPAAANPWDVSQAG